MPSAQELLAAYDSQLRTDAETPSAMSVEQVGPLRLVTFAGGRGFVTYADLAGADAATLCGWVGETLDHFRDQAEISRVEWKTRGHDAAPGLHDSLLEHGFLPDDPESIMIGEARLLASEVALPPDVSLRTVTSPDDVHAMCVMASCVFGDDLADEFTEALLRRLALADGMQLWVAEADGQMISAGRLEPVAGTDFAGLWGGATVSQWRRRGVDRALTAARARAALDLGKTLLHSDSTEFSRPILERSGLIKVSTTTPYEWRR